MPTLLQGRGGKEEKPGEQAARESVAKAACEWCGGGSQDKRQKRQAAEREAYAIEEERADVLHANALGDEGEAPDQGCEQEQEVGANLGGVRRSSVHLSV